VATANMPLQHGGGNCGFHNGGGHGSKGNNPCCVVTHGMFMNFAPTDNDFFMIFLFCLKTQ